MSVQQITMYHISMALINNFYAVWIMKVHARYHQKLQKAMNVHTMTIEVVHHIQTDHKYTAIFQYSCG